MIKNTLPDKSGIPKSLKKNRNSSTNVPIVREDLQRTFYGLLYLQFCNLSDH